MKGKLLAILVVAAFLCLTHAKITDSNIAKDDRTLIPLTDAFGFGSSGGLDITLKHMVIFTTLNNDELPAYEHFGFFLSSVEDDVALEQELFDDTGCVLDNNNLFTFKDSGIKKALSNVSLSFEYHHNMPETGGLYYLYFANCEKNTPVTFDAHIEMYNIDSNGQKDYLSVGEKSLDTLYWVMFALFTFATGAWAVAVWQNKESAHQIHYLMFALGFFKSLTLFSLAFEYHLIKLTGSADGWNIAYYVFTFFRGILFFTVIVLVGTGWSYMKPFLGDKEKKILMVVIPLQVFANIAIIITDEESPSVADWFTWRDIFHLVDIICCCAILFPIVWSIKHLREAAQTDGKAARNLEKLTLFRQFYVMVVVYIYFTRIVVYLLKSTMEYEYSWVGEAADELATLAFYVWTAVKFRPHKENPYLKVTTEDMDL